jgi:hypothetical protein
MDLLFLGLVIACFLVLMRIRKILLALADVIIGESAKTVLNTKRQNPYNHAKLKKKSVKNYADEDDDFDD